MLGGAAIRAYEMARSLADVADVTLAAPGSEPPGLRPARHVPFELDDPRPLRGLFQRRRRGDHAAAQPAWWRAGCARRRRAIVYDLCDPLPLDILEAQASSSRERQLLWHTIALDHFLAALHTGHHFICSGRRQRDLYLGALLASRLITPAAYGADPSFRSFIEQVPFGIPSEPPQRVAGAGPRARSPAIGEDAQIVLWNGGIWNWLDPLHGGRGDGESGRALPAACGWCSCSRTAVGRPRAARGARGARARRAARCARPPRVLQRGAPSRTRERATWLMDADCLVSTHLDHLESNFSFRTRLLDCFWAGVPAVCTAGDELSELIERCDGGVTRAARSTWTRSRTASSRCSAEAPRLIASACWRPVLSSSGLRPWSRCAGSCSSPDPRVRSATPGRGGCRDPCTAGVPQRFAWCAGHAAESASRHQGGELRGHRP